jgi:topoisomerase IA-like protein
MKRESIHFSTAILLLQDRCKIIERENRQMATKKAAKKAPAKKAAKKAPAKKAAKKAVKK